MQRLLFVLVLLTAACHRIPTPKFVYSSGFTFAKYDYIVAASPEGKGAQPVPYGMDVGLTNLMGCYKMQVLGDKELAALPPAAQQRVLVARFALAASGNVHILTVSFDDLLTNRRVAGVSALLGGSVFNERDRTSTFEALSSAIVDALQQQGHTQNSAQPTCQRP